MTQTTDELFCDVVLGDNPFPHGTNWHSLWSFVSERASERVAAFLGGMPDEPEDPDGFVEYAVNACEQKFCIQAHAFGHLYVEAFALREYDRCLSRLSDHILRYNQETEWLPGFVSRERLTSKLEGRLFRLRARYFAIASRLIREREEILARHEVQSILPPYDDSLATLGYEIETGETPTPSDSLTPLDGLTNEYESTSGDMDLERCVVARLRTMETAEAVPIERYPRKGDASLLKGKTLVNFLTAQQYLGIGDRRRQQLMQETAIEQAGNSKMITVASLLRHMPTGCPNRGGD